MAFFTNPARARALFLAAVWIVAGCGGGGVPYMKKEYADAIAEEEAHSVKTNPNNETEFVNESAPAGAPRSRESIQRVVVRNMAALRYAYNERLSEKPEMAGTIKVKFAIDEFGKVFFAKIVESTISDSELEATVVSCVKNWDFGKIDKPGDVTEVTYPFDFSQ
jgi:TonB family protein